MFENKCVCAEKLLSISLQKSPYTLVKIYSCRYFSRKLYTIEIREKDLYN